MDVSARLSIRVWIESWARQTFLVQHVTVGDASSHEGDSAKAGEQDGRGARAAGRMTISCEDRRQRDRDLSLGERARGERRGPDLQLPLRLEFAEWAVVVCRGNRRVRSVVAVATRVIMVSQVRFRERVQTRAAERNQPVEGQQP
jgi:hypothetical protein